MKKGTRSGLMVLVIIIFVFGIILGISTSVKAATSTYDLNSTDSNAYHYIGTSLLKPPTDGAWTAYTGGELTNARNLDALRNSWAGSSDDYANLLYRLKINENVSDITKIDFNWVGYDTLADGNCLYRYIWNDNSSAWEALGEDCLPQAADQEYLDTINSNFDDYINGSGYIYFAIRGGFVGSCPFIYSYDGQNYTLEDEAYSFGILRPWQYESFSLLENLKAINGKYRLKINEELAEISNTYHIRLWVVDHPQGTEVMTDSSGNLYTISEPISPSSAVDFQGRDQIQKIVNKDKQFWESNLEEKDLSQVSDLYDGLILTFPVNGEPGNAKFILKAMEGGLLSSSWGRFLSLIGKNNPQFLESIQSDPEWLTKIQNWVMTEAPLHMSIWNGADWQKVDSLLIGNTEVMQDILVKIDPALISGNEIKIKLTGPVTAYQIDYAVMDFSEQAPLEKIEISPSFAEKSSQGQISDVLNQLKEKDGQEVSLGIGDSIDLEFKEQTYNWKFLGRLFSEGYLPISKRSYFLGVHGYYLTDINNNANLEENLPTIERLFSLEEGYSVRYMLGLEGNEIHHTMYENYLKADITYNQAPTAPTNLYANNTDAQSGDTNPTNINFDGTPHFSAIYNDLDVGNTAKKAQIQIDDDSNFSSVIWDSGASGNTIADCSAGSRCQDLVWNSFGTAPTGGLSTGIVYYWRIKFWDDHDLEGAWSVGTNTFETASILPMSGNLSSLVYYLLKLEIPK